MMYPLSKLLPVRRTAAATLAAFLLLAPISVSARPAPDSFADLVEQLTPAVVNISTTQKLAGHPNMVEPFPDLPEGAPYDDFRDFFEKFRENGPNASDEEMGLDRKAFSLGSGFVIDESGYIVTNNHVIADAEQITVTFSDGLEMEATIIGRDPKTDLALLKIQAGKKLPYVIFGDSNASRVGDWIIAIGNPFGLGGSVSAGIISARARDINAGPFDDFLQTDAAINTGNSGGPMFNMKGEVIGINTAIYSPSGGNVGIGFATPSSMAKPVIAQIKQHGRVKRALLGVKIQTVSPEIAESLGLKNADGALVVEVTEGSPAAQASILPGDVILKFDGKQVSEMRKFPRLVADTPIGKSVEVELWRQNNIVNTQVMLTEAKEEEPVAPAAPEEEIPEAPPAKTVLGMELTPLTEPLRKERELSNDIEGLLIVNVERGSIAAQNGIRPEDIIVKVNERSVKTAEDLSARVAEAKQAGRNFALLRVLRGSDTLFLPLPTAGTDKR